jgi:hypothetical protein
MTDQATRAANWVELEERAADALDGLGRAMVRSWKYPEGELIVTGSGVDLLGALLSQIALDAPVEIRIRLDETGRIPGARR